MSLIPFSILFYFNSQNATFNTQKSFIDYSFTYTLKHVHFRKRNTTRNWEFWKYIWKLRIWSLHIYPCFYIFGLSLGSCIKQRLRRFCAHSFFGELVPRSKKRKRDSGKERQPIQSITYMATGAQCQWELHSMHLRIVCGKHKSREYLYIVSISHWSRIPHEMLSTILFQVHTPSRPQKRGRRIIVKTWYSWVTTMHIWLFQE